MAETTTTAKAEGGLLTSLLDAPLIALGLSDKIPDGGTVLVGMLEGLLVGWILGIMRAKNKPDANILGF